MHSFVDPQYEKEVEASVGKMSAHTKKGEEGYLYRVGSGVKGSPLWVKRWYRSHDNGVALPEGAHGSATSPYFHALRKMEYDLAYQAFPDYFVKMIGAYDTRIGEDGSLCIAPGYPTTLTEEPAHDPELLDRRNKIVDRDYDK